MNKSDDEPYWAQTKFDIKVSVLEILLGSTSTVLEILLGSTSTDVWMRSSFNGWKNPMTNRIDAETISESNSSVLEILRGSTSTYGNYDSAYLQPLYSVV